MCFAGNAATDNCLARERTITVNNDQNWLLLKADPLQKTLDNLQIPCGYASPDLTYCNFLSQAPKRESFVFLTTLFERAEASSFHCTGRVVGSIPA